MTPIAAALAAAGFALLVLAVIIVVRTLGRRARGGSLWQWLQTWWLRVPVPRELSMAFTLLYALALGTGLATVLSPPTSLSREVGGPQIMASVGVLLALGALISMWGGSREHWKVERIGLWGMSWALVIYAGIVFTLHVSQPGSRLTQLGVIGMALVAFLIRFLMIWRFTYRPRG